jgi:DNA primase
LVEAPIDALSLAMCGFPSLALCGTSGPSWLHLACGLRRVALAFDADEAGDAAAIAIGAQIAPFGARCQRLRPEGFKDWNEWLMERGTEELEIFLAERLLEGEI